MSNIYLWVLHQVKIRGKDRSSSQSVFILLIVSSQNYVLPCKVFICPKRYFEIMSIYKIKGICKFVRESLFFPWCGFFHTFLVIMHYDEHMYYVYLSFCRTDASMLFKLSFPEMRSNNNKHCKVLVSCSGQNIPKDSNILELTLCLD